LVGWAQAYGTISRVGVEGAGAYGAGLTRYLRAAGHQVVEVNRPNRQTRRRKGKSDSVDVAAAAWAASCGEASGIPKARDGRVEAICALRVARRSAIKARTQAANQLGGLIISAPNVLRAELRVVPTVARVDNAASFQPQDKLSDPTLGGRDARGRVPRSSCAAWDPAADRARWRSSGRKFTKCCADRLRSQYGTDGDG
jgi:transposase